MGPVLIYFSIKNKVDITPRRIELVNKPSRNKTKNKSREKETVKEPYLWLHIWDERHKIKSYFLVRPLY